MQSAKFSAIMRTKSPGTLRNIPPMKKGSRWLWIGTTALATLSSAFGQVVSDYKALITDGGEIRLLRTGQSMCKVRYGLFYDNWQELRAYDVGPNSDGSWSSKGSLGSGEMNIRSTVNVIGNVARLTLQATPTRTITSNSSHINIRFDETFWADSTLNAITYSTVFPRMITSTITSSGKKTDKFIVTSPHGLNMTFQLPGSYDYAVRDGRVYGVGYEIRAQQSSGTWNAGVTKTYVIDLVPNIAMPIGPNQPITVQAGTDWSPVDHKLRVTPGSALDWSTVNAPAAGSKGFIKASASGTFYAESEPLKPLKFFGTNISGSACFLAPEVHDRLADDIARMGYNLVRLHHFDDPIVSGTAANSTTMNPLYLQRFHYLIDAFRKRGIYVAIDLFSARTTKTNEIITGNLTWLEYKMLLLVNSTARANWQAYSMNLLNSVSPFTGRKLKDEPTLAFMTLVNEQTPLAFKKGSMRPEIFTQLEAATGRPWTVNTDADARTCDQLITNQYEWMKSVLRSNGVKALFSLHNVGMENASAGTRSRVDFQDAHFYYSHPMWLENPWALPVSILPTAPIRNMQFLGTIAGNRVHNKPFFVGEHDGSAPSPYRGEYGLTMGALAAVQKWDALLRFGYTDRIQYMDSVLPTQWFVTLSDPAGLATERAIKALYHRGDLQVTDTTSVINVPYSTSGLSDNRNVPLVKNGALLKPFAMSNTTGASTLDTPILDGISARADGSVVADLFQQSLKINTPATCGVVANPGAVQTAGNLSVLLSSARASVWASSVDGAPLANSKRILIVHLTEVQNSGTTWSGDERSVVTNMGTLPHIARNGSAAITLTLQNPSTARVYRLDTSGRRIAAVPLVKTLTSVSFNATTRNPSNGQATFYYELVR